MRLLSLVGLYILSFIGLFIYILINSIKFNTLTNDLEAKHIIFRVVPQGWAFFTKNPRENQVLIYKIENGYAVDCNFKHNNYQYLFGLNRTCTKVSTEIEFIKSKINSDLWSSTRWNYQSNRPIYSIPKGVKQTRMTSKFSDPEIIGSYLLVLQEPVPWAWSKQDKSIKMPAKMVQIEILPSLKVN